MACSKTIQEWEKLFDACDKNKDGSLDLFELRDLLRQGNSKLSDKEIANTFIAFDGPQGDKRISKQEFIAGLNQIFQFIKLLEDLFKRLDKDNSGFLDKGELNTLLKSSGKTFTDAEADEIFRSCDTSGDGRISFDELLRAVS